MGLFDKEREIIPYQVITGNYNAEVWPLGRYAIIPYQVITGNYNEQIKEIKDNLTKKKEEQAKTEKENAVVDKAVENATMEIPEAMIDTQVENMVDDFARRIQSQGLSMEQYMQFTGATVDSLKEQMKPQAVKRIESRLVLEKVAEAENIQISDEKLDEELAKMAEMYKMELDKFKELVGEYEKEQMKKDLAVQEAVTLMADSAKEA